MSFQKSSAISVPSFLSIIPQICRKCKGVRHICKKECAAPAHICLPISAALTIICRSAPAKEAARAPPAKFAGTGEKPPRKVCAAALGEKSTACGGRRPPPHCFFSNKRFLQAKRLLKGTRGHMRPLQGSAPAGGASFILPPSAPDQVKTNRFAEADSAAARFPFAAISIAQIAGFARFWQLPHKNGKICAYAAGKKSCTALYRARCHDSMW